MFKKYQGKLFCFSPPVMLATLIIEFSMAIYTFARYKMTTISRLVVTILITLGLFQLSEYMICGGWGLTHAEWAKFGYIATALLPTLGLHLIIAISGKKKPLLISIAYATSAIFLIYYAVDKSSINGQQCFANYAVFYARGVISQLFSIYYFFWLTVDLFMALHWSNQLPDKRKTLRSIILGGFIFVIPTYIFNIIDPTTIKGIPSIMCGFAVVFAFILVIAVLPDNCKKRISK